MWALLRRNKIGTQTETETDRERQKEKEATGKSVLPVVDTHTP